MILSFIFFFCFKKYAQIIKERMRSSSHEVHGTEPMDNESFAEFGKSEIFTLKTSMAKIRYANTYKMEPYRKFQAHLVRNKAQHILTQRLQETKYNGVTSIFLCNSISEEILTAVKDMGFDRYKSPADGSGMLQGTTGFQLNVKQNPSFHWL
ncbi:dynein light chain Tctex-type protein 2 isoform X3 [Gopherus flavomarginatus]|uniref:dynein light chain Tctex-type protein 2 isoform X3 n=1 Tax=Gopherus flavomarginatus TaxID=286002 RepID=UPI0021CBD6AE|nr:dynein light chain Tctex-type protein 2 isoform X3 [Gopherus flavomarginatus]